LAVKARENRVYQPFLKIRIASICFILILRRVYNKIINAKKFILFVLIDLGLIFNGLLNSDSQSTVSFEPVLPN
jgi:hypothetical protein